MNRRRVRLSQGTPIERIDSRRGLLLVDQSIRPVSWRAVGRVVEQGRAELFDAWSCL